MLRTSIEAPETEDTPRMALIRRRMREGYYDRPEVRRGLGRLLLRKLIRNRPPKSGGGPESA